MQSPEIIDSLVHSLFPNYGKSPEIIDSPVHSLFPNKLWKESRNNGFTCLQPTDDKKWIAESRKILDLPVSVHNTQYNKPNW